MLYDSNMLRGLGHIAKADDMAVVVLMRLAQVKENAEPLPTNTKTLHILFAVVKQEVPEVNVINNPKWRFQAVRADKNVWEPTWADRIRPCASHTGVGLQLGLGDV
jgi:hypothetical protein